MRKKNRLIDRAIQGSLKIVRRKSPAEAYFRDDHGFVVGCSEKRHVEFEKILEMVWEAWERGDVATKGAAVALRNELVAA